MSARTPSTPKVFNTAPAKKSGSVVKKRLGALKHWMIVIQPTETTLATDPAITACATIHGVEGVEDVSLNVDVTDGVCTYSVSKCTRRTGFGFGSVCTDVRDKTGKVRNVLLDIPLNRWKRDKHGAYCKIDGESIPKEVLAMARQVEERHPADVYEAEHYEEEREGNWDL